MNGWCQSLDWMISRSHSVTAFNQSTLPISVRLPTPSSSSSTGWWFASPSPWMPNHTHCLWCLPSHLPCSTSSGRWPAPASSPWGECLFAHLPLSSSSPTPSASTCLQYQYSQCCWEPTGKSWWNLHQIRLKLLRLSACLIHSLHVSACQYNLLIS